MSDLAGLFNVPGTAEEFSQWSFAHAAHHVDIARIIYQLYAEALPQYVLDPFDPANPSAAESWAYLHQQMHQNQNEILGIAGFDLSTVNWQDEKQRAAWVQLNANEHFQAANILELG